MAKFIVRRILMLLLTMILVSLAVFLITESSPGNVARNVLGAFVTPEQEASFLAQVGLDKPVYVRYWYWLFGSDWSAAGKVGMPLKRVTTEDGFQEWWAVRDDGAAAPRHRGGLAGTNREDRGVRLPLRPRALRGLAGGVRPLGRAQGRRADDTGGAQRRASL